VACWYLQAVFLALPGPESSHFSLHVVCWWTWHTVHIVGVSEFNGGLVTVCLILSVLLGWVNNLGMYSVAEVYSSCLSIRCGYSEHWREPNSKEAHHALQHLPLHVLNYKLVFSRGLQEWRQHCPVGHLGITPSLLRTSVFNLSSILCP